MPTRQASIYQDTFELGSFRDFSPNRIPDGGALTLNDCFVEESGAAVERGGTVYRSDTAFNSSLRWVWSGHFDAGQRVVFASTDNFGVLAADDESPVDLGSDGLSLPATSALVAGMLFIGGGYIYAGSRKAAYTTSGGNTHLTAGSATVTDASGGFTANVDPGMLMQLGNERVYVVASVDSDTQVTLRSEYDDEANLIGYQGSTSTTANVTFHSLYKITAADPYPDATIYDSTAGRLVWADRNFVKASEIDAPHDATATIGAIQIPLEHELPSGELVTGLGNTGLLQIVFTTGGIWTLDGLQVDIVAPTGNPQHRLQRLSHEHILWSRAGITGFEQGLVVPCLDGIYVIDGTSEPYLVSHPFEEHVRDYVKRGYICGGAIVSRGHYLLPICTTNGAMRDLMVSRLRHPINVKGQRVHPWTHFDRHAGDLICFAHEIAEGQAPVLLGASAASDARVVECPFFTPSAAVATDADGQVPTLELISREFPTGGDTKNMVRNVRTRYELVGAGGSTPELEFSYAIGGAVSGLTSYDDGSLYDASGVVYVEASEEQGFTVLDCPGPESTGRTPHRCRVNSASRFFKWRIRNPEPSASCRIRSIDLRVRPSQARRI